MMKEFIKSLNKSSTTTIISILTLLLTFGLLYIVVLGLAKAEVQTLIQIVQGVLGFFGLILGFYFGSKVKEKEEISE